MTHTMQTQITTKHYLSLVAIMLLAPLVPFAIRSNEFELTPEENTFVNGYIRYGWYIVRLCVVAGILSLIHMFFYESMIVQYISQGLLMLVIALIFRGMLSILHNQTILSTHLASTNELIPVTAGLAYLPGYNLYAQFTTTTPSYWVTESVLLWDLYIVALYISPTTLVAIIGGVIIARRALSVACGVDVIPENWKQKLQKIYTLHTEEIVALAIWSLRPGKKQPADIEKTIYATNRRIINLRALIPTLLTIAALGWLARTRCLESTSHLQIIIGSYIYILWRGFVQTTAQALCYQPGYDHIIRLFIRKTPVGPSGS